jgi:hypothetical protein
VAVKGCELLRIYDGKVREDDAYWDSYSLFEQLGLIPGMAELAQAKANAGTREQPHVH